MSSDKSTCAAHASNTYPGSCPVVTRGLNHLDLLAIGVCDFRAFPLLLNTPISAGECVRTTCGRDTQKAHQLMLNGPSENRVRLSISVIVDAQPILPPSSRPQRIWLSKATSAPTTGNSCSFYRSRRSTLGEDSRAYLFRVRRGLSRKSRRAQRSQQGRPNAAYRWVVRSGRARSRAPGPRPGPPVQSAE